MSLIRSTSIAIAVLAAALMSSGCCLTSTCSSSPYGGSVCGGSGCGDLGCTDAGCDSCGGGPAMPCTAGGPCGLGLGLGRFASLFKISNYGCYGSCGGAGNAGCGEVYYHDWISDPPCADPCDCDGHYTGVANAGCGCGGGAVEASCGIAAPSRGFQAEPSCGLAMGPTCGLASGPSCGVAGCDSCGGGGGGFSSGGCGLGRGGLVQVPGRILYRTFTGFGGLLRNFGTGLFPNHGACNAFTASGSSCVACQVQGAGGCAACESGEIYLGSNSGNPTPALLSGTSVANNSRVPHQVRKTTGPVRRTPHPVVAQRFSTRR